MMMHCHVSPSPKLSTTLPMGRRFVPSPRLRLRPRRLLAACSARNRGGETDARPHNFDKERRHVFSQIGKIYQIQEGLLYDDSRGVSAYLCSLAQHALDLASRIVDSAKLKNITAPNEIPVDTIHRTLRAYVETLVQVADAAYDRTVDIETITSYLGVLRGMASVTHILLDDALEALSHEHPRESLSEYALNSDVKIMQREYNRRMYELEDDIKRAPEVYHTRELVSKTIRQGLRATESIVGLMMARRERALGKSNSKVIE